MREYQIKQMQTTKVSRGKWAVVTRQELEGYPVLKHALQFDQELRKIRIGDIVTFRIGRMKNGEFGIGRVKEISNDKSTLTIHRYGLRNAREANTRMRFRGTYRPLFVNKSGVEARDNPDEGDLADEVIVSRGDLLTHGFELERKRIPEKIQRVLQDCVLMKLSMFRDRLHKAYFAWEHVRVLGDHLTLLIRRRSKTCWSSNASKD